MLHTVSLSVEEWWWTTYKVWNKIHFALQLWRPIRSFLQKYNVVHLRRALVLWTPPHVVHIANNEIVLQSSFLQQYKTPLKKYDVMQDVLLLGYWYGSSCSWYQGRQYWSCSTMRATTIRYQSQRYQGAWNEAMSLVSWLTLDHRDCEHRNVLFRSNSYVWDRHYAYLCLCVCVCLCDDCVCW